MSKTIFMVTPHHSGTWFAIRLLLGHPAVDSFIQLRNLKKNILTGKVIKENDGEFVSLNGYTVIHTHLLEALRYEWLAQAIFVMMLTNPTVMSIRDPLAAVVTRQNRHPELNHFDIIDTYIRTIEYAQALEDYNPVIFFPIDVGNTLSERHAKVVHVLSSLGLEPEPTASSFSERWPEPEDFYADKTLWPLYNAKPEYDLKVAYYKGDAYYVRAKVSLEWDYLVTNESKLRPFLETLGYRDLLWWT